MGHPSNGWRLVNVLYAVGGVLALLVFVYLLYALIRAERF